MFNALLSVSQLFLWTLFSFFIFFIVRHLFIKQKKFIVLYHLVLFCILFILAIGGGGVQNDSYRRLEEFTRLEKNNELEFAKKNLKNYDSMLQIDLQEFNNASEFRDYIKANEAHIDKAEAIFIGWLFVLIAEIATMVVHLLSWIRNKIFTNK